MYRIWQTQPDYSHGFLVPFLAVGLTWARRDLIPEQKPAPVVGLALVLLGLFVRYAAEIYFFTPIVNWSILILIAGAVTAACGLRVLWWACPAILFLGFAMPLPYQAEVMLRQPLQMLATKISSAALVIVGFPAVAEGSVIRIGTEVYGVSEACSGLRIFWGIAAFAYAIAVFSRRMWLSKLLLVFSVIPVAIVANSVRIIVTCILFEKAGTEIAKKFSHDIAGIFMVPLAVVLLLGVYRLIASVFQEVTAESIFKSASPRI